MSTLKIRLFGHMEIVRDEESSTRFPTRKAKALLGFLALHCRKLHSREVLAGLFWPESPEASARKRLRTELWLTRKFLEPAAGNGESVLTARGGSVGFNPRADVWIDAAEFEEKLEAFGYGGRAPTAEESRWLKETVELYRGDLLEGHYDDWCLEARERLQALHLSAMERLMSFHQMHRKWDTAILYGQRILGHEPLAEHVHRELMRCYWQMGNRTAALRQYTRCTDLLRAEFDVEPMDETSALFRQIRTSRNPALRPSEAVAAA